MGRAWLTLCILGAALACSLLSPAAGFALGSGAIAGSVEDAGSHAALEEIQACAYRAAGFGEFAGCDATDASGHYLIPELTAGTYKVQFATGYFSDANYLSQYYDGKASWAEAKAVSVGEGATTAAIDAAMHPGGQISGTVTDGSSDPIEGLQVCAREPSGPAPMFCASTGSSGEYTISGLPTGTYTVKFAHGLLNYVSEYYDGKATEAAADTVGVVAGSETSGIDAELEDGGQISGTVLAAVGKAAQQNVEVCAFASGSPEPQSPCAYTNATGEYTLSGLATGSYKVRFRPETSNPVYAAQYYAGKPTFASADPVSVMAGALEPGIDAELAELGKLSGQVSEAGGAGLEGLSVCAVSNDFENLVTRCGLTASSGGYTISGLPAGSYRVTFEGGLEYVSQRYDGKTAQEEGDPVAVSLATTTTGIDAELHKGGKIAGKVIDASSKASLLGIEACAKGPQEFSWSRCAQTDAAGNYTIGGLAAGSYEVQFSSPYFGANQNYLTQYYNGETAFGVGDPVAVSAGATTGSVNAEMHPGGRIAGTVTAADTGLPLEGASVCATPAKGRPSFNCATTDASGVYTISRLPGGSDKVSFSGGYGSPGYLSQYYAGQASRKLATPVAVSAGSTTQSIDAALQPGGKISGNVIDADSEAPAAGLQVCASKPGSESTQCVSTDSAGDYTLGGLASGDYDVHFWQGYGGQGNYLGQYYDGKATKDEAEPVAVSAGSTTSGIDAEMFSGGKIEGTVTDAASEDPAPAVEACAIDSGGEYVRCDYTGASGEYAIQGLPSGTYKVRFVPGQEFPFGTPPNRNYVPHYYDGRAGEGEADPVEVTAGQSSPGIDAEMEEGGKISGEVTGAGGNPVRSAYVCASLPGEDEEGACDDTDAEGKYTIQGLATGSYEVRFWSPGGEANYLSQYYNGKAARAEANLVPVTVGATTPDIDAGLQPGGQIKGRVTAAAGGAPLRYVFVCAYETSGEEEPLNCAETNAKGEYTISGLPGGEYKVEFLAVYDDEEEGLVEEFTTQYFSGQPSLALSSPVSVVAGAVTGPVDAKMVEPGGSPGGGDGGGGGSPPAGPGPVTSPSPPLAPPPLQQPPRPRKPLKCKKGFVKKKVHGKTHCVKVKPHRKKR